MPFCEVKIAWYSGMKLKTNSAIEISPALMRLRILEHHGRSTSSISQAWLPQRRVRSLCRKDRSTAGMEAVPEQRDLTSPEERKSTYIYHRRDILTAQDSIATQKSSSIDCDNRRITPTVRRPNRYSAHITLISVQNARNHHRTSPTNNPNTLQTDALPHAHAPRPIPPNLLPLNRNHRRRNQNPKPPHTRSAHKPMAPTAPEQILPLLRAASCLGDQLNHHAD